MPGQERLRKRLLYDLSAIPKPPVFVEDGKELELEVRVVYQREVLTSIKKVDKSFKIGNNEKIVDLPVAEEFFKEDSFLLVDGANNTVYLNKDFKGYVVEKTKITEIKDFSGKDFVISKDNFAVIHFGDISVVALMTPKEKMIKTSLLKSFDYTFGGMLAGASIFGYLMLSMVMEIPPIEVDIFEVDNRFAKLIVNPNQDDIKVEEVKEEKKVKLEKPKEGIVNADTTRKSLGDEGRVGDKKSRVANAQGSAMRGLDEKVASGSGIMGALTSGAASFDRVFGGGGLGTGMDKTLGSVTGISGVDQFGSGGLGTRGFGSGGGGNALGIGGLGTKGRGGGGGASGYGMAGGAIGGKRQSAIRAGGGQAVIMGALDRAVIDAYIRRNLAKIQWCYEKELNKDPKLFGKVVINFIIDKNGEVSSSKVGRSTMGNANVEECIAGQIKKIRFPQPKGGGIVVVNYPFVFKNSEEG